MDIEQSTTNRISRNKTAFVLAAAVAIAAVGIFAGLYNASHVNSVNGVHSSASEFSPMINKEKPSVDTFASLAKQIEMNPHTSTSPAKEVRGY